MIVMAYPTGLKRSAIDVARKNVSKRRTGLKNLPAKHARQIEELPSKQAEEVAEKERLLAQAEEHLRRLEDAESGLRVVQIGTRR